MSPEIDNDDLSNEDLPGSWLIGELSGMFGVPDDVVPCPHCGAALERIGVGLWACEKCCRTWGPEEIVHGESRDKV